MRAPLVGLLVAGLLVPLTACERTHGGPGVYPARGVVEDVDPERGMVLIDHEEVEGLMQAMTMTFAVPDAELLAGLVPGQEIEFEIEFTGRSYDVVSARVVGEGGPADGWRRLGDALVRSRPAPDFALVDQAGRSVALGDLSERVLLVDFVFTRCPGPCPVQTSNLVALQARLPEALRDDVHFVSISLDPAFDRPEVLERYARERGADLARWSFLTGEPDHVEAVVRAWGVGSTRQADGTIDHTLLVFLVRDGRILDHFPSGPGQVDALHDAIVAAVVSS